jgi:CubicO group peptidase (beta-lactamase class C family)
MDAALLRGMFEELQRRPEFITSRAALVLRNGHLVAEGGLHGADPNARREVRSVAKSVTGLLLGITLGEHAVRAVDRRVSEFLPIRDGIDPGWMGVSIRDLLTHRAGFEWREALPWYLGSAQWDMRRMRSSRDTVRFVLERRIVSRPGVRFNYSTGSWQLVAEVIRREAGSSPLELARRRLFAALGIEDVSWEQGPDGLTYGGSGLSLAPRDLAKIGQLCLQDGRWNGKQVVPEAWVREATRPQVTLEAGEEYGYGWWVKPWGYAAHGYGGQAVYVVPRHGIVVVFTAGAHGPYNIRSRSLDRLVERHVIAAVRQ